MSEHPYSKLKDFRDFPRQAVDARVRLKGVSQDGELHAPALISDLSLGGVRLSTPAELQLDQLVELIPYLEIEPLSPLHKSLKFCVVWQSADDPLPGDDHEWDFYGLSHTGSVLDILESWVGHLLLRRYKTEDIALQRREHRRLQIPSKAAQNLDIQVSHNHHHYDWSLIDLAPGGLLAQGKATIPVGVHLSIPGGLSPDLHSPGLDRSHDLSGTIIDAHGAGDSIFYRVSFDPDCELDEDHILAWAQNLGGTFE